MIFNSTDLSVPSEEKATSGLPSAWATETLRKYLQSLIKKKKLMLLAFYVKLQGVDIRHACGHLNMGTCPHRQIMPILY